MSVADFRNFGAQEALRIASGAVSLTKSYATMSSEGEASLDDLETINGGVIGDILIVKTTGTAVNHRQGGPRVIALSA